MSQATETTHESSSPPSQAQVSGNSESEDQSPKSYKIDVYNGILEESISKRLPDNALEVNVADSSNKRESNKAPEYFGEDDVINFLRKINNAHASNTITINNFTRCYKKGMDPESGIDEQTYDYYLDKETLPLLYWYKIR